MVEPLYWLIVFWPGPPSSIPERGDRDTAGAERHLGILRWRGIRHAGIDPTLLSPWLFSIFPVQTLDHPHNDEAIMVPYALQLFCLYMANIVRNVEFDVRVDTRTCNEWRWSHIFDQKTSVAHPECLSQIQDPNFSIPDPGQKGGPGCLSLIRIFILPDPGGRKHWVPDTDPQNCKRIGLCDFKLDWLN